MRHVGVLEAKTQLSSLLDAIQTGGEPVVITRHGKPVARLSAEPDLEASGRRLTGQELLARSRAFRAGLTYDPGSAVSWEELKDGGRG